MPASIVAAHILQSLGSVVVAYGLSCPEACGGLSRPGMEAMSPELAGMLIVTGPPGKPE